MERLEAVRALVLEHTVPEGPLQAMMLGLLHTVELQHAALNALGEQVEDLQDRMGELEMSL